MTIRKTLPLVKTIFEVIHAAGGYTAWSDKHPAYDLVNGPSGTRVADLYTPEVNSLIKNGGVANGVDLAGTLALCDGTTNSLPLAKVSDYTTCDPAVEANDDVKVQAVVNEIDGKKSDGSKPAPAIFGMNFQTVSRAGPAPLSDNGDRRSDTFDNGNRTARSSERRRGGKRASD
jgi:hypothetical protein